MTWLLAGNGLGENSSNIVKPTMQNHQTPKYLMTCLHNPVASARKGGKVEHGAVDSTQRQSTDRMKERPRIHEGHEENITRQLV